MYLPRPQLPDLSDLDHLKSSSIEVVQFILFRTSPWLQSMGSLRVGRTRLSDFTFTFHYHALEKEMATHSCSCLENPRDGGAWWAAIYGVAESDTTEVT